jgi:hypothetical protein
LNRDALRVRIGEERRCRSMVHNLNVREPWHWQGAEQLCEAGSGT